MLSSILGKQRLCKIKTSSFLPSYRLNVINNSDVIFMPLVAACIQFKYFSFHYTIGSTLLTFKGLIHKGQGEGTISYFMQGLASRLGFPALSNKPRHRECFRATWNMSGWGQRMMGGGAFGARREPSLFFFFKKELSHLCSKRE